jgi:hypothetical protein
MRSAAYQRPEIAKKTPDKARPGYFVKGRCGRGWFVPLDKVGEDYALFMEQADHLSPDEAKKKSQENREFWPTWFAEQCNLWCDIERLGTLVKASTLFKTKKALDRCRGSDSDDIDDYFEAFEDDDFS